MTNRSTGELQDDAASRDQRHAIERAASPSKHHGRRKRYVPYPSVPRPHCRYASNPLAAAMERLGPLQGHLTFGCSPDSFRDSSPHPSDWSMSLPRSPNSWDGSIWCSWSHCSRWCGSADWPQSWLASSSMRQAERTRPSSIEEGAGIGQRRGIGPAPQPSCRVTGPSVPSSLRTQDVGDCGPGLDRPTQSSLRMTE